ncbi:MAG: hypothetical protein KF683_08725 [Rubrivivax sp.]|nr:hypothetical protein [Rubrivivax sp.]
MALQALTKAEQAATRRPSAPAASARGADGAWTATPALLATRRAAAAACLGTTDDTPPPARQQAPLAVGQIPGPDMQRDARPLPATAPSRAPMPPAALTPPLHITTVCNADGCWTTEGRRLQRQGPVLQGPRGPCLQIGGVLNCP